MREKGSDGIKGSLASHRIEIRKIRKLNRLATVINALGLALGLAVMFVSTMAAMILVIVSIFAYALLRNWAGSREDKLDDLLYASQQETSIDSPALVKELARQIAHQIPIGGMAEDGKLHVDLPKQVTITADFSDLRAKGRLKVEEQGPGTRSEESE